MENALKYSHSLIKKLIQRYPSGNFIDATLGKGLDSKFILTQENFKGFLYAFDIQPIALEISQERLVNHPKIKQAAYQLIQDSHENIGSHITEDTPIHGAIFNLGYLPSGDHSITTHYQSTLTATQEIIKRLCHKGQIIFVVYWGHESGKVEKNKLMDFVSQLDQKEFEVLNYRFVNQKNYPPELIVIERK